MILNKKKALKKFANHEYGVWEKCSAKLHNDPEIIMAAFKQGAGYEELYNSLSEEERSDKENAMLYLRHAQMHSGFSPYLNLPEALRADLDIAMYASTKPALLEEIPLEVRTNKSFLLNFLKNKQYVGIDSFMDRVPEEVFTDHKFFMDAIKIHPYAFQYAPNYLFDKTHEQQLNECYDVLKQSITEFAKNKVYANSAEDAFKMVEKVTNENINKLIQKNSETERIHTKIDSLKTSPKSK